MMTGVCVIWSGCNVAHTESYNRWTLNALMPILEIKPGG